MKNNKILIVVILILSVVLLVQSIYLFQLKRELKREPFLYKNLPINFFESEKDFFREIERLWKDVEKSFQKSFSYFKKDTSKLGLLEEFKSFSPDIDLKESKDYYLITMDIPGIEKEKINIEYKDKNLIISGERQEKEEAKSNHYYRQEREFGYFERRIFLPQDVDIEKMEVSYERGVLMIRIPKKAEFKKT